MKPTAAPKLPVQKKAPACIFLLITDADVSICFRKESSHFCQLAQKLSRQKKEGSVMFVKYSLIKWGSVQEILDIDEQEKPLLLMGHN